MAYRGKVHGKVIVLEDPVELPEGTLVEVEVVLSDSGSTSGLSGIWEDDRGPDEIVRQIREGRTGFGGRTPPL